MERLRRALPFRLLRRDGQVVGCWYTSCAQRVTTADGRRAIFANRHGMVRTHDGRVAGLLDHVELNDGTAADTIRALSVAARDTMAAPRRGSAWAFTTNVRDAAWQVEATWDEGMEAHALHEASLLGEGDGPACGRDRVAAAMGTLHGARAAVLRRFLDTLDPILVDALRPHALDARMTYELDGLLGEAWPLLDVTFGRGAPLRGEVLPVIDDYVRAESVLHGHACWSRDYEGFHIELEEERRAAAIRPFLPEAEACFTDLASPGFG